MELDWQQLPDRLPRLNRLFCQFHIGHKMCKVSSVCISLKSIKRDIKKIQKNHHNPEELVATDVC